MGIITSTLLLMQMYDLHQYFSPTGHIFSGRSILEAVKATAIEAKGEYRLGR